MSPLHLSLSPVPILSDCGESLIPQKRAKLVENLTQQKGYKCLLLGEMVTSDLVYPSLSKRTSGGNGSNVLFSFFDFELRPKIAYVHDFKNTCLFGRAKTGVCRFLWEGNSLFWFLCIHPMMQKWTKRCWARQRGTTSHRCYLDCPDCNT